jgi:hypothetical protein
LQSPPYDSIYIPPGFSDYGASITAIGDIDDDGVTDIAIGAPSYTDSQGVDKAGAIFVVFLNRTLVVKTYTIISDMATSRGLNLPLLVRTFIDNFSILLELSLISFVCLLQSYK